MGITYADIGLRNLFNSNALQTRALVDTGAMYMCVPETMARELGFDTTEVSTAQITLADGTRRQVPRIAPIEITFANRTYTTEALVLGDEPLMGVLPIEAMDLIVDPRAQQLVVNPAHPDAPVFHVK